MKPSFQNPLLRNLALTAFSISFSSLATAGTLFWDGNGTGAVGNPPTAGVGGAGTWDTATTANWWDGTAYQLWNSPDGQDIADFRGTAGTVTVTNTVNVNRINVLTGGYTITGGTLNFPASGVLNTNTTGMLTLSANLSGGLLLNTTGSTATLATSAAVLITGNNTGLTSFEMALNNANNHIIIDSANALGAAGTTVKLTTGILNLGNSDGVNRTYPAWNTELAGGTLRGRFSNSTFTGPITLTANSGMESRNGANAKLTLASTATINLGSNTLRLSAQNSAGSGIDILSNISGTGGILNIAPSGLTNGANGSGIVTLAGTNTHTGGTNVTGTATLNLRRLSSLPATGTLAMATGTTLSLGVATSGDFFSSADLDNLFAATPTGNLANVTLTGTVHVGIDTTAGDFTYSSTISNAARNLTKLGANRLTLTGASAYTGTTTIWDGTLALSGSGTIGSGALSLAGGSLDLGGTSASTGAITISAPAATGETLSNGSITTSSTAATAYQVTSATGNTIISANLLANGTAGLTKTNAGTLTLSGANTYTGGTTVSAGTITFLRPSAIPSTGSVNVVATSTVALGVGPSPTSFSAPSVVSLLAGTLPNVSGTTDYTVGIDTSAGDFTFTSDIVPSTRALTKLGANSLTLTGNNTYDRLITVAEGSLRAGSNTAFNNTGSLAVSPGATFDLNGFDTRFVSMTSTAGTVTTTASGMGTDTFSLTASNLDGIANLFTDNGTRRLKVEITSAASPAAARSATTNVNNTFSGGLVLGNTVRVAVPTGTVGTPGNIVNGPLGRGAVTIAGGNTSTSNGAQIWFNTPNRTLVNDVIVNGNAGNGSRSGSFRISATGSTISGNVEASGTDAWFGADTASTLLLSGRLSGARGFRFYNSSGTVTWSVTLNNATATPNDYSGNTTVENSTITLALGAPEQIPNGAGRGNLALPFGTFDLAGFNETLNGLVGGATASVDNVSTGTSNTLTLGDGDATATYSGIIRNTTGTLAITKIGTGTQTLGGINTYTGRTTVQAGTLALAAAGTIDNSPVTIAPGSTLQTTAKTTFAAATGQTITFGVNGAGAGSSGRINAAGINLSTIAATFNITGPLDDPAYILATYTSKSGTAFLSAPTVPGYVIDYNYNNGTQIALVQSATPPSPYQTWIGSFPSLTGNDALPTADPDGDGLTNQQEFAFGLIPTSGSSVNPYLAQLDKTSGQFSYQRLANSGLTYTIWTSDNLVNWTQDSAATQTPTASGANESVQVTLSASKPLSSSRLFVRVQAN